MAQFTPVLTKGRYDQFKNRHTAIAAGAPYKDVPDMPGSTDEMIAAEEIALKLPQFDWTFEVDVLGGHRITLHFGGGEIDIDE